MKRLAVILFFICIIITACRKDSQIGDPFAYDPTPYKFNIPLTYGWSLFPVPADNPQTEAGVRLGRKLFFEPMLSANNGKSCASCHNPAFAFSDNGNAFSEGVTGEKGTRNAMPLFNLGWTDKYNLTIHRYFWDGGANDLERQAIGPITSPIEMAANLNDVTRKLQNHPEYPGLFRKAFGSDSITTSKLTKALSQFERTLISSNSPYDKAERKERLRTQSEHNGMIIYISESKGDCFHCHGNLSAPFFTDFSFHNNGLDKVSSDQGLARITGKAEDMGKFKVPSLRNLVFTAPYMHDGRFKTLQEVVEFYNSGTQNAATVSPFISKHFAAGGLNLTPQDKIDLLTFLISLSDTSFVLNSKYSEP
ncbi:MAG: cytochrome c peroxidase [Bacteroidota bacterium]|nr:cytochrome c peroxidase [Bacteroidota bacterium]